MAKIRFLILSFCVAFSMNAEERFRETFTSTSQTSMEGMVNSLIGGCVCAISGDFVYGHRDLTLPGPEPLTLQRTYSSGDNSSSYFYTGWQLSHPTELVLEKKSEGEPLRKYCYAKVYQPSGACFEYKQPIRIKDKDKHYSLVLNSTKGLTNCSSLGISSKSNLLQQKVNYNKSTNICDVVDGGGETRYFRRASKDPETSYFNQVSHLKNSGNVFLYDYDNDHIKSMKVANQKSQLAFSNLKFTRLKGKTVDGTHFKEMRVDASDGRRISYQFLESKADRKFYYLTKVVPSDAPWEQFDYIKKSGSDYSYINRIKKPDNRYTQIQYYSKGSNQVGNATIDISSSEDLRLNRVMTLQAPVGTDPTPITTHYFFYHIYNEQIDGASQMINRLTAVYDIYGQQTLYHCDQDHRLTAVEKFQDGNICSREGYLWQGHFLRGKYLQDNNRTHYARIFKYDPKGNIEGDWIYGDLTGKSISPVTIQNGERQGGECYYKGYWYSNDSRNLVVQEAEDSGKMISYTYEPHTDRLTSKLKSFGGKVLFREFYEYDSNGVLKKAIVDDGATSDQNNLSGVSQRKVTYYFPQTKAPIGLPERVDEKSLDLATGKEVLCKRILYTYNPQGKVLREDIYGSDEAFCYSLSWDYDAHDNESYHKNALGEEMTKEYDANDNLTKEIGPRPNYHKKYTYDFSNRLIKLDVVDGKEHYVTRHRYDFLSRRTHTIDQYEQETRYRYDALGRVFETFHPTVNDENGNPIQPTVKTEYDVAGNQTSIQDPKGNITKKCYNARNQPTKISYPDGTQETFEYNPEGLLIKKVAKNGQTTLYGHDDILGRITSQEEYMGSEQLSKCTCTYKGPHLIASTDAEGVTTNYSYDFHGRLLEQQCGVSRTTYTYDSLGRAIKITYWNGSEAKVQAYKYDWADRVTEERIEDLEEHVFTSVNYRYDTQGNRTEEIRENSVNKTDYDPFGRPIRTVNGMGEETHYVYAKDKPADDNNRSPRTDHHHHIRCSTSSCRSYSSKSLWRDHCQTRDLLRRCG